MKSEGEGSNNGNDITVNSDELDDFEYSDAIQFD